jgi:RNA polymerase sigma-70 factor (ECF subfamily)
MTSKRVARPSTSDRLGADSPLADWLDAFDGEFDHVYRALRRHGVAADDAEDLAQDAFVVMWRRRADYDPERSLRAWLSGIALKLALDHRRRRGREVPSGFIDRQDDAARPDERIASASARLLVRESLSQLSPKHRAVIVMHDLDGVPMQHIARELGVPLQTAYSRLRAARLSFAKTVRRIQTKAAFAGGARTTPDGLLEVERLTPPPPAPAEVRRRVLKRLRLAMLSPAHVPAPSADLPAPTAPPSPSRGLPLGKVAALAAAVVLGGGALVTAIVARKAVGAVSSVPARVPAPAAAPARPPGDLVGHWRFDDGAGSALVRDRSGTGADCQMRRTVDPRSDWIPGRIGGALHLGGDGWLECPAAVFAGRAFRAMTVSAWVRKDPEQSGRRAVVTRQLGTGNLDYFFLGFVRGNVAVASSHLRGGTVEWPLPPDPARWLHLAATFDERGTTRLYVDGEEVGSAPGQALSMAGGENPLLIGAGLNFPHDGATQRLMGALDEVALYDRALSADEVSAVAAGTQPRR